MATSMQEIAQAALDSAERSGDKNVAPVLLVWGNPVDGFKYVGPVLPNDPELEDFTDRLTGADWWYVPVKTLEQAKRALS